MYTIIVSHDQFSVHRTAVIHVLDDEAIKCVPSAERHRLPRRRQHLFACHPPSGVHRREGCLGFAPAEMSGLSDTPSRSVEAEQLGPDSRLKALPVLRHQFSGDASSGSCLCLDLKLPLQMSVPAVT